MQRNGCVNVAWALFWGGSGARNLAFSVKVAAAGAEGQLVCEAVAGAFVSTRNRFLHCILQRAGANRSVMVA